MPIALIWAKRWITDDGKLLDRLNAAGEAAAAKPETRGSAEIIAAAAEARAQGNPDLAVKSALASIDVSAPHDGLCNLLSSSFYWATSIYWARLGSTRRGAFVAFSPPSPLIFITPCGRVWAV